MNRTNLFSYLFVSDLATVNFIQTKCCRFSLQNSYYILLKMAKRFRQSVFLLKLAIQLQQIVPKLVILKTLEFRC